MNIVQNLSFQYLVERLIRNMSENELQKDFEFKKCLSGMNITYGRGHWLTNRRRLQVTIRIPRVRVASGKDECRRS